MRGRQVPGRSSISTTRLTSTCLWASWHSGPTRSNWGGRCFDEVVLHAFFTDETTARSVQTVKKAAEQAGRDPDSVKVWSCFATVGDHIPEDKRLMKLVGRLATYLQGYGQLLVRTNGWDRAALERILADPIVKSVPGLDIYGTRDQLEHVAELIPDTWLASAATGTPEQCVGAIRNQLDLGCDGVIMHGATPDELAPIVDAYRALGVPARNPGADRDGGHRWKK